MKNIQIGYDDKLDKLIIQCPVWANDALAGIDPKRWSKSRRAWTAPLMRRNVEAVEDLIRGGVAGVQPEATAAMEAAKERQQRMQVVQGGFPHWFPFKTTPLVKQLEAMNKAYGHDAFAMHMDRGTGKSKVAIDLAAAYRMEGQIDAVVIIVKNALRLNWVGYDIGTEVGEREGFLGHCAIPADLFLPESGSDKMFDRWMRKEKDFPVLIVSTESLSQGRMVDLVKRYCMSYSRVMAVIDESHMIGNYDSIRTKRCIDLRVMTTKRLTLTGTPIMTGPLNLFSQFEFLDPNVIGIGDWYAFRNRYAVMGGYRDPETGRPREIVGYQNLDELCATVAPYVFECRKEEVMDLPPKVYEKRVLKLTAEQRDLYRTIKREEAYEWDDTEMAINSTLELTLRLQQVCGGFITTWKEEETTKANGEIRVKRVPISHPIIPPEKNPKIQEVLDIAESGEPMIVWCAYKPEIEAVVAALQKKFPGELVREIHGGISDEDRDQFKNEFQSGKCRFIVGNTATGGTGLTLTAAKIMVYYNNTQLMVDREQSEDRAHRYGLKHSVLYIDLVMDKTVDETVMRAVKDKMDLAEFIRANIRAADTRSKQQVRDVLLGEG